MQLGTQRGLATVRHVFDTAISRFTVQAFATGLLSVLGHNPTIAIRDYTGEVQFVPGTYDKALLHVIVNASGLEVLDEMKRDDRRKLEYAMFAEVLDVEHFPTVSYESSQLAVRTVNDGLLEVSVTGDLTLHGATRAHSFDASVRNMGSVMRISGGFTLRQSDYGIKPVSFAGGALRLKDELKFKFEIAARHQE